MPWDPSSVLGAAWDVVKEHWLVLIFAILIGTWVPAIPSSILNQAKPGGAASVVVWFVGLIIQLALTAFFAVGLCRLLVAGARREPMDFATLVQGGSAFWRMFGAELLVGLIGWALVVTTMAPACALAANELGIDAITNPELLKHRFDRLTAAPALAFAAGMLVLVVLTIFVTMRLRFASYYVADAGRGAVESLGASWAATEGQVGQLFVYGLLSGLLGLAGVCACCIGFFPVLAVTQLGHAIIYTRISGRMGAATENPY